MKPNPRFKASEGVAARHKMFKLRVLLRKNRIHQHKTQPVRVNLTANAITLHLNVIVHDRHGIEAQMVRTGTGADVIGSRIDELPTSVVEDTLRDYPRVNLKGNLMMAFEEELMHRPCCRISFMQKYLGFGKRVHQSCFSE